MASQHHVIPHVTQIASRISSVQVGGAKVTSSGSWIVEHLTRNPSAAVPSLHAAYSFTVVLMAFSISRKLGRIAIPYAIAMWFTIVFFAEHYVSDALIGVALAAVVWVVVARSCPRTWFAGPFPAPLASARGAPRRPSRAADDRRRCTLVARASSTSTRGASAAGTARRVRFGG